MRIRNIEEPKVKIKDVEDYSTFKGLLKNKYLPMLLIAYTVFVVLNAVLTILDGSYVLGGINLVVQAAVCAALWIFRKADLADDKLTDKGTKLFQVVHAVKYLISFILLVVLLVIIFIFWINNMNEANKVLAKVKEQTNLEAIKAAKAAMGKVFWTYLGLFVLDIAVIVVTCVYYKAVMATVDGYKKYLEKGTHFWNDIKFASIYLFVTAGILVLFGVLGVTGILPGLFAKLNSANYTLFNGGTGVFALIAKVLFAALLVCVGLLLNKAYKLLSTTETSNKFVFDIETNECLRSATQEDFDAEAAYLKAILGEEEEEEVYYQESEEEKTA